jgi:hypothetical protein
LIERPEFDLHSRGRNAAHGIEDVSGELTHLGSARASRAGFGAPAETHVLINQELEK